jgi:uncharacterized protein (DUF849 family)
MIDNRYEPSTLTAAITGGDVLPCQSEHIPSGADGIVTAALGAARAGASAVHLHARDETGRPSADPDLYRDIVSRIRAESDVVINVTTGGAPGMTVDERLAGIRATLPEIATFNLGTMNYEGFPTRARWPSPRYEWERELLQESGSGMLVNTLSMLREFAAVARELGVTPELEAYDLGHVHMARFLIDEGTLQPPVRIQLVLGVLGGAGNDLEDLFAIRERAIQVLGDDLGRLGVAATGYPMQFRHAAVALAAGMDTRVGLEDSLRLSRDQVAVTNAEMVEVAARIADAVGRPIASPQELRNSLTPWSPRAEAHA